MTFTVTIQYRNGERYVDRFEVDKRVGYPTFGMLPGGIERRVSWVQLELYCGESKKPVLVTPRIVLPNGLERKDGFNYYYHVDWESLAVTESEGPVGIR